MFALREANGNFLIWHFQKDVCSFLKKLDCKKAKADLLDKTAILRQN